MTMIDETKYVQAVNRLREQEKYIATRLSLAKDKEQEAAYYEGMLYSIKFALQVLGQRLHTIVQLREY